MYCLGGGGTLSTKHPLLKKGLIKCFILGMVPRSRKIKGRRKCGKTSNSQNHENSRNIGHRNRTDHPEHRCQACGTKRSAILGQDFASDYQYHGRQQEAPRIAQTRLLYSAKASQRRDERPQDASSNHRY